MVEIFKTSVQKKAQSRTLLYILSKKFPTYKINFDLTDCDKILRVEGEMIKASGVISLLMENGFKCEIIE